MLKNENQENNSTFVYVTYIRTTPEKLWQALTNGDFSVQYWMGWRIDSTWKIGDEIRISAPTKVDLDVPEECVQDVIGKVLVCEPPHKLSYSFGGNDKPEVAKKRSAPSRVTYEIKVMGMMVRLRLIHENLLADDMESNPDTWRGVNNGWPAIISSLKSLLETGQSITFHK